MAPGEQPLCMSLADSQAGAAQFGGSWTFLRLHQASFVLRSRSRLTPRSFLGTAWYACLPYAGHITSHGSKPEIKLLLQADPDSPGTILHQGRAGAGKQARHCAC